MTELWKYKGPIFDAHTHIGSPENIDRMIGIEDEFGISVQVGIVHSEDGYRYARERYPNRFFFAKYLSLKDIAHFEVDKVVEDINVLKEQGYSLAKTWFGPRWRNYVEGVPRGFRIDDSRFEPIFQTLEDNEIPLLIHIADPDTYFATQYRDATIYGTKEENLDQIVRVIQDHPRLTFQIPHFGAQPEIHRLPNLAVWLEQFPNMVIDTASSRWMARELSKNVKSAHAFMMKYSDRVLFGTDLSSGNDDKGYYSGRYIAQRFLWETDVREEPLPFEDADTKDSGGTFINGLDLPLSVLRKLYWENAVRIYGSPN